MKITEVRACQPLSPTSPADWRTSLGQILVAIDTDVGLTGYGVGGGGAAGIHVVRTVLRERLLGRDPAPLAKLWDDMYASILAFGRKGLAIMALSGVDLALWDLAGKAAKTSVANLLGGAKHRRAPVYVTVWDDLPPDLVGKYSAYKLHVGNSLETSPTDLEARLTDFRRALGPAPQLMIDAWMRWTIPHTLEVARRVAPLGVAWIEEPLSPDDLAGYAELTRNCPIPIAGGEHEFTAIGFRELIDRRLHQVLQPDVCWCGGMTQLVKIYALAHAAGLRVCPHRGAEIWSLPALAALDPEPLAESGRPWIDWVPGQPAIQDGFIDLPEGWGFGADIDESRLRT